MGDILDFQPLLRHQNEISDSYELSYELFQKYVAVIKQDPTDLSAINGIVSGLQDYIFLSNQEKYSQHSPIDLFLNKVFSAFCNMKAIYGIADKSYLSPLYLCIMAQNCFAAGNWKDAIDWYKLLLQHPSIRAADFSAKHYAGELELASKIVHNLCVLYTLDNEFGKALGLRNQYAYIFELEEQRAERSAERMSLEGDVSLAEHIQNDFCAVSQKMEIFYIEATLFHFRADENTLSAKYSDCLAAKRYVELNLDIQLKIQKEEVFIHLLDENDKIVLSTMPWDTRMKLAENAEEAQPPQNEPAEEKTASQENPPEISPMDELNELVGLDSIKQDVQAMFHLAKMQKLRQSRGMKAVPLSLHLVFTGNPGTGKTTVARILGKLYRDIGVLKTGQLVEVDRADLVAGYVGQTAIKTQKKIQEAMGGILFIDEAYALVKDFNDYGQEAIDTIIKAMEDHRDDFIVIVAGYDEPMKHFINSNPGLKSRFNKFFHFPDFNYDELYQIFQSLCEKYEYGITPSALQKVRQVIHAMEANKETHFANAREIRNYFESIITKQSSRVAMLSNAADDQYFTITEDDV